MSIDASASSSPHNFGNKVTMQALEYNVGGSGLMILLLLLPAVIVAAENLVVPSLDGFTHLQLSAATGQPLSVDVNGTTTQFTSAGTGLALTFEGVPPKDVGLPTSTKTPSGASDLLLCWSGASCVCFSQYFFRGIAW